ncbi:MAG TPA: hypothetical protein VG454_14490 [Gemmatimonadales bacterium]|nr:hypothetical protein [Gemmatimonadales bacterium]
MRKRSLWIRAPLLLIALLQLSIPGAVAWADSQAGDMVAGPAHIESHSTDACPRVHPSDCAFHRFLTAPLAGHPATVWRIREGQARGPVPIMRAHARGVIGLILHDSRAPPTLS